MKLFSRLMTLIGLFCLCGVPLFAQDSDTGYAGARNRIEAARLNKWIGLNLGGLELTTLPPEIGQLSGLVSLYLTRTQVTTLPSEIGQLSNLEYLLISGASLTHLPAEIGQLKQLKVFDLSNNQLTTLPLELGQLTKLRDLRLDGNPLTFPPPEVQAQGTKAILAYLRDYQAMQIRQIIAAIASGVGGIVVLILAFRWRQRRGLVEKKKRM